MAKILDGRVVRNKIAQKLKTLNSKLKTRPKLVIIQVGDLPQSNTYIRQKILFGQKIGAVVNHVKLDKNVGEQKLRTMISKLNTDPSVNGIIIQMTIPKHIDRDKIIDAIVPEKDVDGLTSTNLKLLWEDRQEGYTPATTAGILTLLRYHNIAIAGKHVVVVGRSSLVGKPTTLAFLNRDATVTVCHSQTKNLKAETNKADILIVAVGKPNLITKDHVSRGQVVIDVGINIAEVEPPQKKLVGDVDFEKVSKIVAAITPVPGGVGPMTVASLFENLLEAFTRQNPK
ncbi:hypothetical protein A2696_01945 [Candidatus Curtissbacteria bacterium RIFCSPHIGHO2_01_FULL_41_13]|uniref:Bifunctional protein FolD n=1 Tax=Candidatus Curtissbacteria bacterium RIFCSPHIGHO2_01_FULL_41_13 TaxID=1797745 RepID=A0A1F5FY55_9BACT|nr:MAG: hypothetical protein A2696_01945 [Candidatus Curtissbacteria bacterium RIFCSPHIGHO2_01_FULL_41_13]